MNNNRDIIKAIGDGINLHSKTPFLDLANELGRSEEFVIDSIKKLKADGSIKRFGVVVKNRSIGFVHNAMVTLNVPNELVDNLGEAISKYDFIKLCYQRVKLPGVWDYNLYFMVHGKDRALVLGQINQIIYELKLENIKHEILFSTKCLKQKGASY